MWVKVGEWIGRLSTGLIIVAQFSAFFWLRQHFQLDLIDTGGLMAAWLFGVVMWWRFMQMHHAVLTLEGRMRDYIDHKFKILEKDQSWHLSRIVEIERRVEIIQGNTENIERVYSR